MIEKNKILESWIMVEHLSEGDIGLNDKAILTLNDLQEQDFYSLFLHEIEKKKWNQRQKGGVVVYFDIFKFQEVVDILRSEYGLESTDEDIRFGNKFSFALYFDKNLKFLEDMTFFTESAYIRKFKKVPYEKEFREFEKDFKNQLAQDFDETAGDSVKFNAAMQKELLRHEVDIINCRMKILGNIETEATNLHSFFIDDLEKAKKIETVNLNAYLYGDKKERMNLDSKKDSVNFHPHLFEQILQPKNYPLGRFPSNTTYALSLMQQVAVNLSIGFDNNQMRSVNGPPGTGKTTLLKDIFAQLVVQQALKEVQNRAEAVRKNMDSMNQCFQVHKEQRPSFFAGKKKKEEYRNRLNEITAQFVKLNEEDIECRKQEKEINETMHLWQTKLSQSNAKQGELKQKFDSWKTAETGIISNLEKRVREYENIKNDSKTEPLNMNREYEDLQISNPWFDEAYRVAQSKLFVMALRVRKQFLYENRKNVKAAIIVWEQQEKYLERKHVIEAAWNWINMTIPVISSTFASFSRMCRNLGAETLGHLFIDEAGQALPQAAVGAIYRSRHVMVVGDPLQIKPVLTLDSNTLYMLGEHFGVTEKYLSASASVQILADAASQYGFYRKQDKAEDSWVGIPLWVHRRCRYPMFTISNMISYDGFMVQGMEKYGKTDWFDVGGTANNKYVEDQGEFLLNKLKEMIDKNPKILDKKGKDVVYVITPFSNVAYQLSQKLRKIHFTRYDEQGKPTNVGTVHTFQGKEAPIVFFVLGADRQSSGAARWAVTEANIMNVAATRAKEEFYIIGDRKLYLGLGCDVATDTDRIIREYKNQ